METQKLLALPSNARTPEEEKEAMLAALEQHHSIAGMAAKEKNIDIAKHYQWLKTDAAYRDKVNTIAERALDKVEEDLYKLIEKGHITAIIFYLRTKGQHRGYAQNNGNMYMPAPPHTATIIPETEAETRWRTSI